MARWARDGGDFPDELRDPAAPGWFEGCLSWLEAHPRQRVPFGQHGDATDVYRLSCEMARSYGQDPA